MTASGKRAAEDDGTDDVVSAAEYVLGLLDPVTRRAAQARLASDSAFAWRVAWWEARLAEWLLEALPVAPGSAAWLRLRTRLGWGRGTPPGR